MNELVRNSEYVAVSLGEPGRVTRNRFLMAGGGVAFVLFVSYHAQGLIDRLVSDGQTYEQVQAKGILNAAVTVCIENLIAPPIPLASGPVGPMILDMPFAGIGREFGRLEIGMQIPKAIKVIGNDPRQLDNKKGWDYWLAFKHPQNGEIAFTWAAIFDDKKVEFAAEHNVSKRIKKPAPVAEGV